MPKPLEDMIKRKARPEPPVKIRKLPVSPAAPKRRPPESEPYKEPVAKRSRYMLWSVAAFSITLFLLALSFIWSKAEVEIYPRTEALELNDNFMAIKASQNSGLGFELVVMHGEESKVLAATEEKELAERATGTVLIFNSYSTAVQRLDVDTRLSGSNGKLYKTKSRVTVPGRKADGTPGMVEVGIYAAEAGEEYNSGPLDFNIVGFQGTPKAEGFKVRSKTGTDIAGGFRGKTLVAGAEEREQAASELKTALEEELFKKATEELPEGFVLFKDATVFVPGRVDLPLGNDELVATFDGTLYGLLFKEEELAQRIAAKKAVGYENEPVFIPNLHDMKFTLGNIGDVSLEAMDNISFNLSGKADLVWKLDTEKFTGDIKGRAKKDFTSILSAYKNIERAELSLVPFWKRTVPDETDKIDIVVHYPEEK